MIYFYHIQRTGGRSLSQSVLREFSDPLLWAKCHSGKGPVIECDGKKILPWHANPLTSSDDFFYSWSHVPAWRFPLPDHCFTITILRDPVTRFTSMYRYLRKFDYIDSPRTAGHFDPHQYLRDTILKTAAAFPSIHRYQMLYHFSGALDMDEAVRKVQGLSYWFRTENYAEGLADLRGLLGFSMPLVHYGDEDIPLQTRRDVAAELTPAVCAELIEIFKPEYELLEELGALWT